ncbi:toll-like receptor 1 [Mytilus galloprovincialis]|uniref:toll-like receptor 1 n=1 Tax=Mytilus galloprovincialis TaxID=29158 RepID=UPI003F7BFC55
MIYNWTIHVFLHILFLVFVYGDPKDRNCLKRYCSCSRKKLKTSCFSLIYIPNIPEYSGTLEMTNNKIPHINVTLFRNVSGNHIKILIFRNNSIKTITSDAFVTLNHLERLQISNEPNLDIFALSKSFNSLNKSLIDVLRFEGNNWKMLPNNIFDSLTGSNLSQISLNDNNLPNVDTAVFRPFYRVRKIYCRKNKVVNIMIDEIGFRTVEHIDLTSNNINSVPKFCNGEKCLAPRLRVLTLNDNALRFLEPISFKCLYRLEELRLDSNRFTSLGNNVFTYLTNLKRLTINTAHRITRLSPLVFNSSSLQKLQFAQNGFIFDKCKQGVACERYDVDTIFRFLPKLVDLDLTKNFLPDDTEFLLRMFSPLVKLQKLNLHSASLDKLPYNLFQKMQHLEILILSGNKLAKWNQNTFVNVTSLRKLHIQGNNINLINKTTFPLNLLLSLEKLDLTSNPFWCTCDLMWFLDTIRKTNLSKTLTMWPSRYACSYPNELKYRWLKNYRPTVESCTPWDPTDTIIAFVFLGVLLVVISVTIILKCQTNIRNILYLIRLHRHKRRNCSSDLPAKYEFDAFIVYCDSDRHWVHGELLKRLEEVNLRICVHYRDFEAGQPITSNIENFMNKSWKIIVVMSNNFAKSEWCQWELCLVQERRRRKGSNAMVLIMRQQIDSKHMTSPLRTLLYTTPYLTWKSGLGQNIFWKAVIKGIKKTYSDPPIAVNLVDPCSLKT